MQFDIITIFPHIFDSYINESILKRAQDAGSVSFHAHDLREYTTDKHRSVDDVPYGGGAGMVLKIQPIYDAVNRLKEQGTRGEYQGKTRTILFSAKGKRYTQRDAERLSKYDRLIMICGRYEGVDERVAQHIADEEISIGEYVLTGGELPAMIVADSITRLLPGVLGNEESLKEESFGQGTSIKGQVSREAENLREYPHYTRPEEFNGWKVPEVLLGGNHAEIEKWRRERRLMLT